MVLVSLQVGFPNGDLTLSKQLLIDVGNEHDNNVHNIVNDWFDDLTVEIASNINKEKE